MPSADSKEPPTYRVVCISMYVDDLAKLDELVTDLKARGVTKANRSSIIRLALGRLKLDDIPTSGRL